MQKNMQGSLQAGSL